jgi:uncharacterized protein with FMN-binding domain
MRRAATVIASTAGGLALIAAFHTSPEGSLPVADATTTTVPASTTAPSTTAPSPGGGAAPTTTAPAATRTVDGPVIGTDYGDVQVRIVLTGSRITDAQTLKLPSDRSRSRRISQAAGPLLITETLKAQSAKIDAVSGATYTSEGYLESLQGALDKAKK